MIIQAVALLKVDIRVGIWFRSSFFYLSFYVLRAMHNRSIPLE